MQPGGCNARDAAARFPVSSSRTARDGVDARLSDGSYMMLKIQCVLYESDPAPLERFLAALAACVQAAEQDILVHLGDCSARPLLTHEAVATWQQALGTGSRVAARYEFFGENLGFGRAHNHLWHAAPTADRLLVINPDTLPPFHLLTRLNRLASARPDWGAVEARQVPLEHARPFDLETGETDWVSGACCLLEAAAFAAVGGFDEHFFLYGEDVDLSWRLRATGRRLYVCPDTFVYHAKRLVAGRVGASAAERYHGALSSLLLRAKYGREDLNARPLAFLRDDPRPDQQRMLADYERLRVLLTPATARERAVPTFTPKGAFGDLRWTYPLPGAVPAHEP
jgi:GT2 family glycosyltransferase